MTAFEREVVKHYKTYQKVFISDVRRLIYKHKLVITDEL